MAKARKKPVVIDYVRWTGDNFAEVEEFASGFRRIERVGPFIHILTSEGVMQADLQDVIIKGVKGEIYPCKPDIFAATYEPVEPPHAT